MKMAPFSYFAVPKSPKFYDATNCSAFYALAILIHSESALSGYFLMSYECQVQTPYLASKNGVLTFSL